MWGPMTQSRHKSFTYAKWNPIGNTEPQNGKIVGNFPAGVHCTHFLNNPSAKGALAHLFQHGDNRSYSAGRINWHLQPIGALEVFTSQSQEQCRGSSYYSYCHLNLWQMRNHLVFFCFDLSRCWVEGGIQEHLVNELTVNRSNYRENFSIRETR